MKKRVALGLITAMAISTSVAMASPVDMEEGKANVYIGATFSGDTDLETEGGASLKIDGDTGYYGGVTYGITDKWGVQVDYNNYGAERTRNSAFLEMDVEAIEVNALYKVNPYLNAFIGYVRAEGDLTLGIQNDFALKGSADTDGVQVGLTGSYPFADRWQAFGKVALGNNNSLYEVGVSYEVADNWDIDLSYRNAQYDDFDGLDAEIDGIRLGISTSF